MRVGIIGLMHESNTFIAAPTTFSDFQKDMLLVGEDMRGALESSHHETGGFFEGLQRAGVDAVPVFASRAVPYGAVEDAAFAELRRQIAAELDRAGPLDGLLLAVHGAMVSQSHGDADGYWLMELREKVGLEMPMIATLDPHGNLSPQMVAACDALIAYRTNPHLDQRARGVEAAQLMARTLSSEVRPTMASAFPPLAINIERQATSEPHLASLFDLADEIKQRPGVLTDSIMLGFPYADVNEMGSSAIVVTDGDVNLARRLADELGSALWSQREAFVGQLVEIDDALNRAVDLEGPVCLLDMGDNVGGGSPADGTILAHEIDRRRIGRALVVLYDPQSVEHAARAGIGATVTMQLGGKTDDRHGQPLDGEFTVASLHDGRFTESEPRHGGMVRFDQGPTAIVESAFGLTVMLTSRRMPPFSLNQLISCGLDPASFQIIVAKGVHAPIAAYAPVCKNLIRVNTPGCTSADLESLEFRHRRRPMFPFERERESSPIA